MVFGLFLPKTEEEEKKKKNTYRKWFKINIIKIWNVDKVGRGGGGHNPLVYTVGVVAASGPHIINWEIIAKCIGYI